MGSLSYQGNSGISMEATNEISKYDSKSNI